MPHSTGSFNGLYDTLIFTQQWLPDTPPHAGVIIVHGIAEHSGRYERVAQRLNARGYACYALDHRGHGHSQGPRTDVAAFEDYVADLRTYYELIRRSGPDLPIFLYGHSMGSLIALLYALRHQTELAGLIISGVPLRLPATNAVTRVLVGGVARVLPHLHAIRIDPNGISRDPAVVQAYTTDPLVDHKPIRLGMIAGIIRAGQQIEAQLGTLRLPFLVLHGGDDPISLPAGVESVRALSGSPDTTIKSYAGLFHEIHQEAEWETVLDDITAWLVAHLP